MRDIGSKSTSGPEAVLCAAVDWWLRSSGLHEMVLSALESADPSEMWPRRPEDLAVRLSHRVSWDRLNAHFWATSGTSGPVQHMIEFAVRHWRPRPGGGRVREAKAFVASLILKEAGETILSSGFMEENADAVAAGRSSRRRR